jgi:hyperosmotically inducible periplasmic protein
MLFNKKMVVLVGGLVLGCLLNIPMTLRADEKVMDDAKITLQVKTKLLTEKNVPATKVSVETHNGIVFLSGTLNSEAQAKSVIEAVGAIEEVKEIDTTNLKVDNSRKPLTDSYITAKVKGLLLRKSFVGEPVSATDIKVETKNGIVYLSGNVKDKNKADNAIEVARQVKGVKEVKSLIKVK